MPGQRDQLEVAGGDDERLHADHQRQAGGEDRPELVLRRRGDPQPPLHEHEVQAEDRQDPDEAQLLAEGREREVGVERRDRRPPGDRRQPVPEPRPDEAAARERVQRLDDLEAGALRVDERVDPDVDPRPDVIEHEVQEPRADHERREADDDEADPRGRDVQQEQEDREEQQRGAEVASGR